MKSRQLFFENLIAQNALGGIPEGYNFEGKTLYQIFSDLFKEGTSFTKITLEPNAGLEFSLINELRTKYNTLVPDQTPSQTINLLGPKPASVWKTKTIVQVLDDILFPTSLATYTPSTISLTDSLSAPYYEVGSQQTNNLTLTSIKNDAGIYTALRILRDGGQISSVSDPVGAPQFSQPAGSVYPNPNLPNLRYTLTYADTFIVELGNNFWAGNGDYEAGLPKQNSDGLFDSRPFERRLTTNPQANETQFAAPPTSIEGIYPYFYGVFSSPIAPTPEQIKGIIEAGNANKSLIKADGTISIQFNGTVQYLWFAHASIYPTKTKWQGRNSAINGGNIGISPTDLFGAHSIQEIISPDGSPDPYWTIDYKIYITKGRTSTQDGGLQYIIDLKNS